MQKLKPCKSALYVSQSSVFEVFSIDFAGPFPVTSQFSRFFPLCIEHLNGEPVATPTTRATAKEIVHIRESKVIPLFGASSMVVSDNAGCFTARILQDFVEQWKADWRTVLAYAPVSKERA